MGFGITLGALVLTGCGSGASAANEARDRSVDTADGGDAATSQTQMTVYRDPNCGCCKAWAAQAQQAGFQVKVVDDSDMSAVKRRSGVPEGLASCHTALVAGYTIEGHVPFADVARVLRERPAGVRGLAVPGMPAGSPGMEMPDGTKQPFEVIAFGPGLQTIYSKST